MLARITFTNSSSVEHPIRDFHSLTYEPAIMCSGHVIEPELLTLHTDRGTYEYPFDSIKEIAVVLR